ncbi:hypothetical protein THAOC_06390 [Thalassiosira oceanica]|uniref:Uncharacterized protein n=1 Tax=Thalassiosira oceanica TaxID=159749 RepID=K0TF23_THAOC|nr:hypothetical protein THAOC_06390 [Thalassiosira oceanica]|eukprot:EJK72111.1 hypothetical protein THAOC_06390 [Thalassiosira oceanica]
MEADIRNGNFRKPVSMVASSTPCVADWERNHQESRSRPRPARSAPSTSYPNREATRQSDLLAKLNRLNTDQLSIALRAVAPAEEEKKTMKTNDEIRPCNTERHHRNSNVTNASTDRHSDLLTNLSCLTAERLSIALRAVAQAEKEKKMKKKKNNINLQRNTERRHGNSSVTNASADRKPTVPCPQPRLRADAPPWSPPANDDGSLFPVESSDSYREYELKTRQLDGDILEPPNYQIDARPSLHQTIISDDAPIAPPTDLQTTDANPYATQPVISHQADKIDTPILRTVTYEDDESVNEPNPCERAGTSDALPDPTQARNTTTDNAEDHIAQFIQSMEMTLNDELNEFLQIT